jgi:hypothetical protein
LWSDRQEDNDYFNSKNLTARGAEAGSQTTLEQGLVVRLAPGGSQTDMAYLEHLKFIS